MLARLPVVFMLSVGITSTSRCQSLLNSEIQLQQRFNPGPSRSSVTQEILVDGVWSHMDLSKGGAHEETQRP